MTLITIREHPGASDGPNATVSIDGQGEHLVTIADPFTPEEEARLEWYFERWLRFPFTDQVRAIEAAHSIADYGERLFRQLFADPEAFAEYAAVRQADLSALRIEIAGSPEFQALHWEALYDPSLRTHLALAATMVRRTVKPPPLRATVRPSPTINLLLVTARPGGASDVGYRTIARPLVELLRQSRLPVQVDIVRPGTYEALHHHLADVRDRHGPGYYHIIHFDLHGALLTYEQFEQEAHDLDPQTYRGPRYGRGALPLYMGQRGFLFFEGAQEGEADPAEAGEVAALLQLHQIPICVLNACQSGKQVGATETSLGARLMQAGVQLVLAMGYSVTVSAAERCMRMLYQQLFGGADAAQSVRRARAELAAEKGRRAYYNQTIELEDWLLPVVYQNAPVRLQSTSMSPEETQTFYERQARRYQTGAPTYGFIGRDLDILAIERLLLQRRNLLLVRGMGGAGKTTLLRHLGEWWQGTGLVEQVFEFAYDQRAWTRQQILDALGRGLLSPAEYASQFQPLSLDAQQALITGRLRSQRHLLILDNLESITGSDMAIRHILPEAERATLRGFLADLMGGQTLVLLGSRIAEEWLAPGIFEDNRYDLPGLDEQAASELAERILARQGGAQYRGTRELARLLRLLGGYPLALEVVLPNLARQSPIAVLKALEIGDAGIDSQADTQDKTRSILRCIDYSFSNLDPEAQSLLVCLAPFVGVLFTGMIDVYIARLRAQPALVGLPLERLPAVVQAAVGWGLLASHPQAEGFLAIQPTLPFFLRNRLAGEGLADMDESISKAFVELYQYYGAYLSMLLTASEPDNRTLGLRQFALEYENLMTALNNALSRRILPFGIYEALDEYWDVSQEHQRGIIVGEKVRLAIAQFPAELVQKMEVFFLIGVLETLGLRYRTVNDFVLAERSFREALQLTTQGTSDFELELKSARATNYHNLGSVAQAQRQWVQAEQHYQQALDILAELGDDYNPARTYHNLGMMAQERQQWAQAERYYQEALDIWIAFDERYEQADTYLQLGLVAQAQQQWAQAERYYQEALDIYIVFGDRFNQGGAYHNLGAVAQAQQQLMQAEKHYQESLKVWIEFSDHYRQSFTYHNLSIIAREQRQLAQARDYLLRVLGLLAKFQDEYIVTITLQDLASLRPTNDGGALVTAVAQALGVSIEVAEQRLRDAVSVEGTSEEEEDAHGE